MAKYLPQSVIVYGSHHSDCASQRIFHFPIMFTLLERKSLENETILLFFFLLLSFYFSFLLSFPGTDVSTLSFGKLNNRVKYSTRIGRWCATAKKNCPFDDLKSPSLLSTINFHSFFFFFFPSSSSSFSKQEGNKGKW